MIFPIKMAITAENTPTDATCLVRHVDPQLSKEQAQGDRGRLGRWFWVIRAPGTYTTS
jgi:hypothetical protein